MPRRQAKPVVRSAGILLYRRGGATKEVEVLLGHPGGPFYAKRDAGAWTIPKGLVMEGEALEMAARREFEEELGWRPEGELKPLGEIRMSSGKLVIGFALESIEPAEELLGRFSPGVFTMEWPPRSGRTVEFPEIDRVEFISIEAAREKILAAQMPLLHRLTELIQCT